MPENTPYQFLQDMLSMHIDAAMLVAYHDQTLDDDALRVRLEIHLEICATCRDRSPRCTRSI